MNDPIPLLRRLRPLGLIAVAAAAFACAERGVETARSEQPPGRPNILVLFSDDQRADALGAYGQPVRPHPDPRRPRPSRLQLSRGPHHGLPPRRGLRPEPGDADERTHAVPRVRRPGLRRDVPRGSRAATATSPSAPASGTRAVSRSPAASRVGGGVFFGGMSDHDAVPLQDLLPDGGFSEVETAGFSTDLFVDAAIEFLEGHAADGRVDPLSGLRGLHRAPRSPHPTRGVPVDVCGDRTAACRRTSCRCTPSTTAG